MYGYFKIEGCDKKIEDKLREQKTKEREKKRSRRAEGTHLIQVEQTTQRRVEKKDRAKFNETWSSTSIRVVGEKLHKNFKIGYQVHPLSYVGFGLGIAFARQRNVKQQRKGKMQLATHVLAKL